MDDADVMAKEPSKTTYAVVALKEDGFGVKVSVPGKPATVTEFRTIEEAEAWIAAQRQREEQGY